MGTNVIERALSERQVKADGSDVPPFLNKELIPLVRDIRTALNAQGGSLTNVAIVSTTTNYTIVDETILIYTGTGGSTIALPSAAVDGSNGRARYVVNNGTGTATIAATTGETVNDGASFSLRQSEAVILIPDGSTKWRTDTALLNGTFQPITSTTFADLTLSSGVKVVWAIAARLLANANLNLVIDTIWRLAYTINAQGHTLTNSEIRGFRIQPTVTDAGTATHKPFSISDDDGLNPDLFSIVAGTTRQLQTRLASILINNTSGLQIGTTSSQKLGVHGAAPIVQQVLPTGAGKTSDDIITALQNIGWVRQA